LYLLYQHDNIQHNQLSGTRMSLQDINQMQQSTGSLASAIAPAVQTSMAPQQFAEGGLAAADKSMKTNKIAEILGNYFSNRGIPMDVGMQGVKKEVAEGLKLVPFEDSVMGYKVLKPGVAQVHFFTIGSAQDLSNDIQYFVKELKKVGIRTIYDTEPAPVTTTTLKETGARIEESDIPKYKLKATI
jgi:hypothetical protein